MATDDQNRRIGEAIEKASETLPDGYSIEIIIEEGSGCVSLENQEGQELDFPTNHEDFATEILDALEHAIEDAAP